MVRIGELISVNDDWFEIVRVINEPKALPDDMVVELRDLLKCSHSFRKDDRLYFCRVMETIVPEQEIDSYVEKND